MSLELLILKVFQRFRMAPRLTAMLSLTGNRLLMGMHAVNWFCAIISCALLCTYILCIAVDYCNTIHGV